MGLGQYVSVLWVRPSHRKKALYRVMPTPIPDTEHPTEKDHTCILSNACKAYKRKKRNIFRHLTGLFATRMLPPISFTYKQASRRFLCGRPFRFKPQSGKQKLLPQRLHKGCQSRQSPKSCYSVASALRSPYRPEKALPLSKNAGIPAKAGTPTAIIMIIHQINCEQSYRFGTAQHCVSVSTAAPVANAFFIMMDRY